MPVHLLFMNYFSKEFPTISSKRKTMNKYNSILLTYKHKHHLQSQLLNNRGYKYKCVIMSLMSIIPKKQKKKSENYFMQ